MLAIVLLAGCEGADPDPHAAAAFRVPGAQPHPGTLTAGDGPTITFVDVRTPTLRPGQARYLLAGRAEEAATAVHLQRVGDTRYWIVPTTLPDPANLDELIWSARFDLAPTTPAGPLVVRLRAVDAAGRPGPLAEATFTVGPPEPEGALVVRLRWDVPADLDLYVLDPTGRRLGLDDPNTWSPAPPGSPPDGPDAWRSGGILDRDAGAGCLGEGPLAENAIWSEAAPSGKYLIFLDFADGCGFERAGYEVTVRRAGQLIFEAGGVLYTEDGRHGVLAGGTGLHVGEFEVP